MPADASEDLLRLLPILLLACADKGDTAITDTADADTDTDTDSDTDADTDADTDTDPGTASVSGCVIAHDDGDIGGMEVQICDILCIRVTTDSDGCFVNDGMDAGDYKVDAMGELITDGGYGHSRFHLVLTAGQAHTFGSPMFLPDAGAVQTVSQGTYTYGAVDWTVEVANLETPFGYEEDQFWVSWVDGADVPAELGLDAAGAVAFMPFDTEVAGPFDIAVTGTFEAAEYDVYAQGHHGEIEAPIGTATVTDGVLNATGLQPELLTWLIFVAK